MRLLFVLLFVLPLAAQDAATVTGRLLDQDDNPIVGAHVELTSMGNAPGTWKDVQVSSDAGGRFRLRCAPGDEQWFLVSVIARSHATHKQTLQKIGVSEDLGDIVLLPAGVVVGRIVNQAGDALDVKGWKVSARSNAAGFLGGAGKIDGSTGEFRIEDLPAGHVSVTASYGYLETDSVETVVEAGGEVYLELPYSGPDPGRRITVRLRAPRGMFFADARRVTLRDKAGEEQQGREDDLGIDRVYDDLDPGTYTLVIEDPRYERHEQELAPGSHSDVQLVGTGTVRVEVVDAATGEAVPAYQLEVIYPHTNSSPTRAILVSTSGARPAHGVVGGIVPGKVELLVRSAGRPDVLRAVTLEPGVEQAVRFEVPPSQTLTGARVLRGAALRRAGPCSASHGSPPPAAGLLDPWGRAGATRR